MSTVAIPSPRGIRGAWTTAQTAVARVPRRARLAGYAIPFDGTPRSALAPLTFHDWPGMLAVAADAPLVLWGPLLATVTVAYYRRRHQ